MKKSKSLSENLGLMIIISMILGIVVGYFIYKTNVGMFFASNICSNLGDIFMQLLKMVVIPLVATSIISGAASIGNTKSAGKIGGTTFAYYMFTTAFAVVLALIIGNLTQPGVGVDSSITSMFSNEYADKGSLPGFWETIKGIIPTNPIKALVDGNMLQILFFSLFLGFGISSLNEEKKEFILKVFDCITDALIWVINKVLLFAPVGVFALMVYSIATFGFDSLKPIFKLFGVYIVALAIHTFVFYPTMVGMFSKVSPSLFIKKVMKPFSVAFSSASSMGTLPITTETCEDELGVSKEVTSFVLPLGATINMDGNSIYYALVAVFFAQYFGIELTMASYVAIILTATVGSIGQAGVPGPSLLVVAVLLAANIPVEGLPLLFGLDRIFDMLRTAVNITGDASCAVIIENLKQKEEMKALAK
ncbi:dicarboxylate/amino acid:cation symporter [Tepidibacter hydrothermalis]|uniref:Dicarboxylate/amino acid:cation symporter n=1 Tax=Tepidibacter hydrothermalis TaxID=3036126 RepID=A0ABY8EB39_9FIRM|nr:dicarboxylate/amino acid:cation symporter [Tepidibacter hydrothermalis]WFD10147.1 dicarboxylate/amino acid:cation symporter [Tepidibacter hydrothermalis]